MKTITTKKGTELPIMNLKGKDYLQVAHRLVWFREEHPDWSIETEYVALTDQSAFAKAVIRDQSGRIISTSHKEESLKDFPMGYREKAETGAIGRALALCGYGTQFEPDLDEGSRVVDSPLGAQSSVYPEQPSPGDGVPDDSYRIPFGKYAKRSLEEIQLNDLRSYVEYIEGKAQKDGKPLSGPVLEFVERASAHIAAYENGAA